MCGIAGIFHYNKSQPINPDLIRKMCDLQRHRGPDEEGFFFDEKKRLGLGHRRLSIIDLQTGQQPMSDQSQRVWIVFNGEIYNFLELKKELEEKGFRFKTKCDTEVILYLYLAQGPQAFDRLNGIFSFALWDTEKKTLFLARDHFGVKPLYYWDQGGQVVFASEIKAILAHPDYQREIDPVSLDQFLTFRYNPSPETLFKGIKKLTPGYFVCFGEHVQPQVESFVKAHQLVTPRSSIGFSDALEQYRQLLSVAVKRQMMSDVPVGLLLSGGIDSAALGFLMRRHTSGTIQSFTIGFEGAGDYNELADAKKTASLIDTQHQAITISFHDYLDFFCQSLCVVEEPIAQTTIPALHYVSKLAASHVKVVLAGQGADEPLAGYQRYQGMRLLYQYAFALKFIPAQWGQSLFKHHERLTRGMYAAQMTNRFDQILAMYTIFTNEQKKLLLKQPLNSLSDKKLYRVLLRFNNLYKESQHLLDPLNQMLYIDTRMSLSDNLLNFNDKISMYHSLEMRVPFLDGPLIAFLESLPSKFKLKGKQGKFIHKKALEAWLPKEIIYRQKRGFETPMDQWLKTEFSSQVKNLLLAPHSGCLQYFNRTFIEQMINDHRSGKQNYFQQIFLLLSFELWFQSFFKNQHLDRNVFKS